MSMQPSIQSAFLPQIAIPEVSVEPPRSLESKESEASTSRSMLANLPMPLRSHQVPLVLKQLAEAIEALPLQATEAELRQLVQWGLSQSYSEELTPMQRMELLNLVWQVQKWLWS